MAIIGVKTHLNVSIEAKDTPKTTLIQNTDNGSGIQESHITTGFGSELVSNGDFPTVTTGWTAVNSVLSIDTARLKITNSGANQGYAHQAITTVIGKTYRLQFDVTLGNASKANIFVGNSIGSDALGRKVVVEDGTIVFVATATTTYIHLQNYRETLHAWSLLHPLRPSHRPSVPPGSEVRHDRKVRCRVDQ